MFRLLAFLSAIVLCVPALAQTTGHLAVTVIDGEMLLPIPGVEVEVTSADEAVSHSVSTDEAGHASFETAPGRYQVSMQKAGFRSLVLEDIAVLVGRTTTRRLRMKMSDASETIEVVARRDVVEVESTSSTEVLTRDFLERIPAGHSYQSAVAPGSAGGHTYRLGGADITNPVTGTFTTSKRRRRKKAPREEAAPPPASRPAPRPVAPAIPTVAAPIKAGMTDDNRDFLAFLDFLSSWSAVGRVDPVAVDDRRQITVVDPDGQPVPNARIEVLDRRRDRVVWRGTTFGDGGSAFYAKDAKIQSRDLLVQARAHGQWEAVRWEGGEDLVIELPAKTATPSLVPLDVVVIVDTTGSMSDEFHAIKATLLAVTEQARQLQRPVDLRWGAVLYRDRGDAYVTQKIEFTDATDFAEVLSRATTDGGGDTPESLNQALNEAINDMDWRDDGARMGFLVADAEPHMDYGDPTYADAARDALKAGMRIHTVAASGLSQAGTYVYRQIAQLTRGKFIYIDYGRGTGRSHGVTGQPTENNLDAILSGRIREEVEGFGRRMDGLATK